MIFVTRHDMSRYSSNLCKSLIYAEQETEGQRVASLDALCNVWRMRIASQLFLLLCV